VLTTVGGVVQWSSDTFTGWSLTGNSGTNPSVNFLGTKDDKALVLKVNNTKAGELSSGNSTSFGYKTLISNTTGYGNTAFGKNVLSKNTEGYYNTSVGYDAMAKNTRGKRNTAIGKRALYSNTTGSNNTASGYFALLSNTTGSGNTANGYRTLEANTAGNKNAALGYEALKDNTTGSYNVASGYQSAFKNTAGNYNTVSGYMAMKNNTTGSNNTAIGREALSINKYGNYNTAVGYMANVDGQDFSNVVVIGYQAIAGRSNEVVLGNSDIETFFCQGAYASTTTEQPNMYVNSSGQIMRSTSLDRTFNNLTVNNTISGDIDGNAATANKVNHNLSAGTALEFTSGTNYNGSANRELRVKAGSITSSLLADNSVTSAKIVNGTIQNEDISSSANITVSKLAGGSSNNGKVLKVVSGTPTWSTNTSSDAFTFAEGTGTSNLSSYSASVISIDRTITALPDGDESGQMLVLVYTGGSFNWVNISSTNMRSTRSIWRYRSLTLFWVEDSGTGYWYAADD
jgi:hypothetical protein